MYSGEKELTDLLVKVSKCPVLERSVRLCWFRWSHLFLFILVIKKKKILKESVLLKLKRFSVSYPTDKNA